MLEVDRSGRRRSLMSEGNLGQHGQAYVIDEGANLGHHGPPSYYLGPKGLIMYSHYLLNSYSYLIYHYYVKVLMIIPAVILGQQKC